MINIQNGSIRIINWPKPGVPTRRNWPIKWKRKNRWRKWIIILRFSSQNDAESELDTMNSFEKYFIYHPRMNNSGLQVIRIIIEEYGIDRWSFTLLFIIEISISNRSNHFVLSPYFFYIFLLLFSRWIAEILIKFNEYQINVQLLISNKIYLSFC